MRGGLTPFEGRSDDVGWTAVPRDPDWGGTLLAARDNRTVGLRLDITNTSWAIDDVIVAIGGLPAKFRPTSVTRYHPAMIRSTGDTVWLRVFVNGKVEVVQGGVDGLLADFTFIR